MRRPNGTVLGALALFALAAGAGIRASAAGSFGLTGLAGPQTWGGGAALTQDLDGPGDLSLAGTYQDTIVQDTENLSETHDASLDLSASGDDGWETKLGADFSEDVLNHILFAGPDLGATYSAADDAGTTFAQVGLEATVHAYGVALGSLSTTVATRDDKSSYTLVNNASTLYFTDLYPSVSLALPFGKGKLTPSIAYGRSFYNNNPGVAAEAIDRRFTGGNGGLRISNASDSIYNEGWTGQLVWKAPGRVTLTGTFSAFLLAYPVAWMTQGAATADWDALKSLTISLGWTDTVVGGDAQTQATFGVTTHY